MNDHLITKLAVGAGSPLLGVAVSHQTINEYLQTASLLLGILVGLATLASMFFKKSKR